MSCSYALCGLLRICRGATSYHELMVVILLTNSGYKKRPRAKAGPVGQGGAPLNVVAHTLYDQIVVLVNISNFHQRNLAHPVTTCTRGFDGRNKQIVEGFKRF